MSTFYKHNDKKSGDGLAITDWNELSNAVAGNQGLHLALDATNKVGIGTDDPGAKLEVAGKVKATHFEGNGASLNNLNASKITSGKLAVDRLPSGIVLASGENTTFTGNVGIGTTSPGAKLEINAGAETPLKIMGNGGNYAVGITQNQVGGSATMEFTTADSSGAQATRLLLRGNHDDNDIEFYRGARGSEKVSLFITGTNGNVGIGTSSPVYSLDLGTDSASTIRLVSSKDKGTAIRIGANGFDNDINLLRVDPVNGDTDDKFFGFSLRYMGSRNGNDNSLSIFSDNKKHAEVEALTVLQDGKVGIGTTSPGEKLEVNGTAKVSMLKIGNIVIGEHELNILKKLASGNLSVNIQSRVHSNQYLDHYGGRANQGDSDRTIQMQNGKHGNYTRFKLIIDNG